MTLTKLIYGRVTSMNMIVMMNFQFKQHSKLIFGGGRADKEISLSALPQI